MDNKKIITRINNLEAAARLMLEECHATKELLGDFYPRGARKGKFTEEDAARIRTKIRSKALGHG